MRILKDNANVLVFVSGFSMLMVGLWQLGSHVAWIGGGVLLIVGVVADAALRLCGASREGKA